ncbi:hypothetical protein [Bradyrhizobium sp. Rc2d]|nr:hypothetical protein [Bradyrhizobium sp. Rc2d]
MATAFQLVNDLKLACDVHIAQRNVALCLCQVTSDEPQHAGNLAPDGP